MVNTYISLKKSYLRKTEKKAIEQAQEDLGEDEKDTLTYSDGELELDSSVEEFGIDGDIIKVSIDNDLGYFSFDIPITNEFLISTISHSNDLLKKLKDVLNAAKEV